MKRTRAIRGLLAIVCALAAAAAAGCANPGGGGDGDYYRRGTIHQDAFPPGYVPGRHRGYGYGRHGW